MRSTLGSPQTADQDNGLESADKASGTRPTFTITEAAAACAVSRKTITRKLPDFAQVGAAKDDDGIWRIPVEALLAAGLHPGRSLPAPSVAGAAHVVDLRQSSPPKAQREPKPTPAPMDPDTVTISRDRWDDLRIRLARAEAESVERGRALDDARLALRALTAGPIAVQVPAQPIVAPPLPLATDAQVAGQFDTSVVDPIGGEVKRPASTRAETWLWDTLIPPAEAAPQVFEAGAMAVSADDPRATGRTTDPLFEQRRQAAREAGVPATEIPLSSVPIDSPRRRWWGGLR